MDFWTAIKQQITELKTAENADDVLRILSNDRIPFGGGESSGDGFFAGSGGDDTVIDALDDAGWRLAWWEAGYHFAMTAPDGSGITYVEGDIYRGTER